jgi:6-phosphogluconolactonase
MFGKSLLSLAALTISGAFAASQGSRYVYVGSYGNNLSVFTANPENGNLTLVDQAESLAPSYLAFHPSNQYLYACNELNNTYSAFKVSTNGSLQFINKKDSLGQAPAHVGVHPSGKWLLGTSYNNGTFYTYPIGSDGSLGDANPEVKDPAIYGSNLASLQGHDAPHAHEMIAAYNQSQVLGIDLGIDRINLFNIENDGTLSRSDTQPFININSGAGPRHGIFGKDGKFFYLITEEGNIVIVFKYDASLGTYVFEQSIDTLPANFAKVSYGGEIRISPDWSTLYVSNRVFGPYEGSITVYKINSTTGKLSWLQNIGSAGQYPRGLNIDPEGKFVYSGNQNSNTIGVFKVESEGKLRLSATINHPSPSDFEFGPSH